MMAANIFLYFIGVPLVSGALCLFMPDRLKILTRIFTFIIAVATVIISVDLFLSKPLQWPNEISPVLFVDNLSGFIAMGISIFALLISFYSFGSVEKGVGRYSGYSLLTLGSALGVVLSGNFILLLVFWGLLAALLYLMITMKNTEASARSAKKALIMVGGTDVLMMLGIGLIWSITETFSIVGSRLQLNSTLPTTAYIFMALAGFAKAGIFPLHSWVPDVSEDAEASVSAYLPASLDKLLGIYLLARASLTIFTMNNVSNLCLLAVGSATIVVGVVFALVQHDFKRLLGYHAVSQAGYMVLGIGTGTIAGIGGALFHMLNHAIYKSCLFLTAGSVEKETGTTDLEKLGALARNMPLSFASCLVAALAISGVPPFNGFVSKWMIYQGVIELGTNKGMLWMVWLAAAMFGSALTIASFMKLIHAVFLGRPSKNFDSVREVNFYMACPVLILASLCVIFGVFAFIVPIPLFISPLMGSAFKYDGLWDPVVAAALIAAGLVIGIIGYWLIEPRKFRTTSVFIGGAEAEEVGRVAGTEFYNTIKDFKLFNFFYKKEDTRVFDIYTISRNIVMPFTRFLKYLHNGVLPTYMIWCLLGMIVIFFATIFK